VHDGRGFLVARGRPGAPPGAIGPIVALISGFVVLMLGALVTARWVVRPIDRLTRTARALGEGDLAARSRIENAPGEIAELGKRFDEMADRIERSLRAEKELLANVAHELRTPLSRIGVALDLAGEGDAEAARAALGEIAVDVDELETIVNDVLGTLRFEIGGGDVQLPLRKAISSPAEIASAAIDRMTTRHPGRKLTTRVAEGLPPLDVDPMLVRRVLDNLLENAHKYTPDRDASIELACVRDGAWIEYAVADRGIGIDDHDLPRVFDAFFRSDRSRSRETGGVGLGLTLVKRIVGAHGGTVQVASKVGAGTTVTVRLPIPK
jgi:signal transduction histidine kinase